jgi:pimeloyl-ACP methyl ester carboxylesterase
MRHVWAKVSACVALTVVAAGLTSADRAPSGSPLRLESCQVGGVAAQCGVVSVPENRATGSGREIGVKVVVVPAEEVRLPDPVFWLAGGPGVAATDDLAGAVQFLRVVNRNRDLVFVDQRGTGDSNRLICPQGPDADRWAGDLRACLAALPADPSAYTTAWAMDDLDDVRQALGYDMVNVYGGSYGATAVQVYVQRYPARVRSATLLAGTLLEIPIFERFPANSQRALEAAFVRCAGDPACRATYPDPAGDLRTLTARLDAGPVDLPITDPSTGERARFTRSMLGPGLHTLLRDPATAALVPRVLHSASRGDWNDVLAVQPGSAGSGPPSWVLMNITILCHEPWARLDPARTAEAQGGSYLSYADTRAQTVPEAVCAVMPPPQAAAIYAPSVPVGVPMLFINGEIDPQDPPANVAGAARTYPDSVTIAAEGESHQFARPGCLATVIEAFITTASTRGLPSACLAEGPAL